MLGPSTNTSSYFFIIMIRLSARRLRLVVQCFLEAFIYEVCTRQPLFSTASASLMMMNRWFTVCPGVSSSMVAGMSLMRRSIFFFQLQFRMGHVLVLGERRQVEYRLMPFPSLLLLRYFEQGLNNFLWGFPSVPESERLGAKFSTSLYVSKVFFGSFIASAVLYFFTSIVLSVLDFKNITIGAMNVLEASNLFDNPSAAAWMSKNFAMWASYDSPPMSLCSRSHIPCLATLCMTNRKPQSAMRVAERHLQNFFQQLFDHSGSFFVTMSSSADWTSRLITSSSLVRWFVMWRF